MATTGIFQSSSWIHEIGWTLVHSVWQLAVIAAVYSLIVFSLRHRTAQARYLAGCAALLVMLAAPLGTFAWLSSHDRSESISAAAIFAVAPDGGKVPRFPVDGAPRRIGTTPLQNGGGGALGPSEIGIASLAADANRISAILPRWIASIDSAMPWLSAAWFAGVLAMAVRPLSGWIAVHRLRTQGRSSVSRELQKLAARLTDRMAVRQVVVLAHSALVEVPSVVGYLRPIVLLPATAVSGLSVEQLEMILAHELAHIRRHDYLVNAVQTMVESLLFFHPAVWWVSARVRAERENCCDDIAIAVCGSRESYARALCSLETLRARPMSLAVGATGGSLLDRIRRILGSPANVEPTLGRNAAWVGGLCVVFAMSFAVSILTYNVAAESALAAESADPHVSSNLSRVEDQRLGDTQDLQTSDGLSADVKQAIAAIERLGGDSQRMISDEGLARIVSASLSSEKVTDENLARLAPLTDLHSLVLSRTKVTDAGLKHLQGMKQLQWLELEGTPIKGPGLANLVGMEQLLSLRLGGTKVDDASLVHVMQLKGLRELWVQKTRITQAGLRELWNVRPSLTVVGGDGLEPGDPAEAARLLQEAAVAADARDQLTQHEKAMRVMDALRLRDQRVQSFRFEWKSRHREPPGSLRKLDRLRFDGPTNREEVVYELEKKFAVDRRRMAYALSGQRPRIDNNGDVVMRREIYRSAFDGTTDRSVHEYPDSSERTQGFERVAGAGTSTWLAETAPLLWTFCTFDEAMVSHDLSKLEVLDEPATINGRPCVVLKGTLRPMVLGSQEHPTQNWYVDAEREHAIVRYEHQLPDGQVTFRTDIEHHHDSQWGWVPAKWTVLRAGADGKLQMSAEVTVTQYQINPTLSDEEFVIQFPENTHMNRP
jgi:beta-lactamase regulating signal transducer with metallopeptidase domain